jgi:hypothetical protein
LVSNLGNSVHRFVFDASGNAAANGQITGGGMDHTHAMTFTPWGELLVANVFGNSVSRFTFDAAGNAVPNGLISGGEMAAPIDLDFSPWGELLVTNHNQVPGRVTRWTFTSEDASATAVYQGSFEVPGNLGGIQFPRSDGGGSPPNAPPSLSVDLDVVAASEGDIATNTGTVEDPEGSVVSVTASIGLVTTNGDGSWSWSLATTDGPTESQIVTIDADDGEGGAARTSFELTVHNVAPMLNAVDVPAAPVEIGDQPISVAATFDDPAGAADEAYTCTIHHGDGTGARAGTVTSGSTCGGPDHTYAEPGVYTATVTVADKDGASTSASAESFVVIFDPSGGFVTGGGWFDSAPGAYTSDPTLTGKANFGFVSKYKRGASIPTGNTEFHFRAGGLDFHSSTYQWLVVSQGGTTAQFRGSGLIGGELAPTGAPYQFMIWAGSGNPDTFRIKIWYEDAGEVVVYDNGFDQAIGGGAIKVHSG